MANLQSLGLQSNGLIGTLPSELGNLSDLRELRVEFNVLTAPIPPSITNLTLLGVPFVDWYTPVVDFGYNRLWTDDPVVRAFLDAKDPDWAATQDIAVEAATPGEGGALNLAYPGGGTIALAVPAGAVSETVTLVLAPLAEPANAPSSLFFGGQSFILSAYRDGEMLEGYAFEQPVTVTIVYTDDQIEGVDESTLALYVRAGGSWLDATATCAPPSGYIREPQINRVSVIICHLSQYALFGEPRYRVYLPQIRR